MLAFVHVKKFKLISCHFKKSEKDCYTFWYYFFFSDVISVKCIFVVSIHNSTYREISVFIDMYTRIEQWAQTIYGFVYVKNILEFLLSIPFFGNLFYVFTSQNDSLYFCHLLFFLCLATYQDWMICEKFEMYENVCYKFQIFDMWMKRNISVCCAHESMSLFKTPLLCMKHKE